MQKIRNKNIILPVLAFMVSALMLIILFISMGYAPFGSKTLASMDANIQYLDFFAYLKNVLLGKDSINYSYTNLLGGSSITLVAYYLCSPLNLIVIFFKNTRLPEFFNILVALKISLSATTMSIFLQNRFKNKLNKVIVIALSISYAFMQYNMAQSSNVIWLDGVYMLPLMLLGVYWLANGRGNLLLPISTGLVIIFNWYVGAINCLFSGFWFIFELLLANTGIKGSLKRTILFILSMFEGIILSAFIFIPNFSAMSASSRSQFDWNLLTNTFRASFLSFFQRYTLGGVSDASSISFFCGSFVLIGFISFFITNSIAKKARIITFMMSVLMYLIFFWQPLYLVFSLFKEVDSYWCRYSYVGIFFLIFVAGVFYCEYKGEKATQLFFSVTLIYTGLVLYLNVQQLSWKIYGTCIFAWIIAFTNIWHYKANSKNSFLRYILIIIVGSELLLSAYPLLSLYSSSNASSFKEYESQQSKQINNLKNYDSSNYRILQTGTRNENSDGTTANYNEGMAFNYWSIAGYRSIQSTTQLDLLNNLGYRTEQDRITIVNTPILGSDSLLGIKYILSDYKVNGLSKIKKLGVHNGKSVYKNKYALPMGFVSGSSGTKAVNSNTTFEYQNQVYSNILDKHVKLYTSISYTIKNNGNNMIYNLQLPMDKVAVYGNINWATNMDATLNLNNKRVIGYSKWLSPSVFYIPTTRNEKNATVQLTANSLAVASQEFYALNLRTLANVSKEIQRKKVKVNFNKDSIKSNIYVSKTNQYLYLSIATDNGWQVTNNGKNVKIKSFANSLIAIPLKKGENRIVLKYKVIHQRLGIILTIFGCMLLIVYEYVLRMKH